jgi:high affinity Mn2+ porin
MPTHNHGNTWRVYMILCALCFFRAPATLAQDQTPPQQPSETDQPTDGADFDSTPTMFPHLETDRLWISGQANFISQYHPGFHSPYSGKNSLSAEAQDATSRVLTLFTGLRLTSTSELICDVQETGGNGLGVALGVAGFPNLDVVRNPTLSKAPYIARLMWHQIIPLGHGSTPSDRSPFSLFSVLPERRIEIRFGKFSMVDFFDLNSYGTDSNFQFMNWTVDNAGTFDYAADTRGFTFGAMAEYHHNRHVIVRFAEALMPKVANGIHLDADLSRARAENLEFELRGKVVRRQPDAVLRLLTFVNHANMGDYQTAIDNFLAGLTPIPEITAHPLQTTVKYGFGVNFEQPLNDWIGVFGRWGWNEGEHESYAYTEVDATDEIGLGASGKKWGRRFDRAGMAIVTNGISRDHQEYLALGGDGFLLGDGRLNYGRENIVETYYTMHLWRGFYPSFDFQYIDHPGYNRDRGPVFVPSLRLHLEF